MVAATSAIGTALTVVPGFVEIGHSEKTDSRFVEFLNK